METRIFILRNSSLSYMSTLHSICMYTYTRPQKVGGTNSAKKGFSNYHNACKTKQPATISLKWPSERKRHIGSKMSVRLPAFYLLLFAICSLRQFVTGGLLPNFHLYPNASRSDRSVGWYIYIYWCCCRNCIVSFLLFNSVVVEKQYLIELPVQYEFVPLNNDQINSRSRTEENSQEYPSPNLQQQQEALSGYQYQAPQVQLPPLIRPTIVTTTRRPSFVVAAAPVQAEINANVIQSLVG